MRKIILILAASAAALCLNSCFKEPDTQGYLGDGIYLKGADTMYVTIGRKTASAEAWLDNSTRPVKFEIIAFRDKFGLSNDHFFEKFPSRIWASPYDYLTDKTEKQVMDKLVDIDLSPVMINEVNGQIRTMESTAQCELQDGDIYNVDVRVTNSKGSKILKDYAVICFQGGGAQSSSDFVLDDFVNGIAISNAAGEYVFPYYDQINQNQKDFETRRGHIYADDGVEKNMAIRKISDEPSVGIKFYLKLYDKNGKLFDPASYSTYSTTTSYIDYSINRQNTPDGLLLEFPVTPWPVSDIYSYISGKFSPITTGLDLAGLKSYAAANPGKTNVQAWPDNNYSDAKGWFVRVRSRVRFYSAGTYEMVLKVPFTTAD